jgi:hypothetical protein
MAYTSSETLVGIPAWVKIWAIFSKVSLGMAFSG